ncbi:efflux RND transporter periplasmic adaptor subunit [Mesonia mobilis]|uniref:efflux RND transporter periplasmic adaptor subunit n=1 Tax=Mesonia mobilis TaxID=369791 RepID=UPI0024BBBF93|nr:efflux RND transporter periplasmic adaptor subunit [Mesonia mobilis]
MRRILMFMSLCTIVLTSCESKKHHEELESKYLVSSPIRKDTLISNEYVAQVRSIRNIEIRAQERGYLQDIYVDEGDFVKKGQLMFRIMPKLYEAEQQKAKAEADFARIEYENTKVLADSNVVAKNELAMAKAHYDKANAELALANVHLEFTTIRAPFDGIVDRLHLKLGSLVDEGDLLTTLSDNSEMWVYYNVPEAEYLDYKSNKNSEEKKEVELLMANNKIYNQKGVIETIEGEFNNETGNIAFRANFPNPDGLLRHGETGSILTKIPYKNALLIPQKATFEVLSKHYAYVVNEEGKVEAREITVQAELPHVYLISDGLTVDDKILLEGIRKVRDGDHIEFDFEEPEEVIAHLELYAE